MNTQLQQSDLYLWAEGTNTYSYLSLGCHKMVYGGENAFRFAVWAPNARNVSVVGSFNSWDPEADPMEPCGTTGVWEVAVAAARPGDTYKFAIRTRAQELIYKADPFAFYSQYRPSTASVVWDINDGFAWNDSEFILKRDLRDSHASPVNIYEVHLGSWRGEMDFDGFSDQLVRYAKDMGYTHIELMPLSEYPLDDSWGYQVTGYYSITSRYGTPTQFKRFVDRCHSEGLGVILDWVPAHFTKDAHGLARFDGTPLFEHPDPRRSEQPQWGTLLFNFEKNEVRSFLISNALFFFKEYHIDGLRLDAASCMLYHDYAKSPGTWLPNFYGGNENLDAMDFLRQLSRATKKEFPSALLIAEESSTFPGITAPVKDGGLGLDYKWNMGWMNDTLSYMSLDSVYRRWHHDRVTFSMCYAFREHYILPLSHDEVVHGKHSLIGRMPGGYEDKFRQLRMLFMYQMAHPGKKLTFMGNEFGQFIEWDYHHSLDWLLLNYPSHSDLQTFSCQLNRFYLNNPPLYELDDSWEGFEWLSVDDSIHSVLAFLRRDSQNREILCAFNFTPVNHSNYRIHLPHRSALTQVMSNVDLRSIKGIKSFEAEGELFAEISLSPYEAVYYRLD